MDSFFEQSNITPIEARTLSKSAAFRRIKVGSRTIDCYESTDVSRATIDAMVENFKNIIKDWPANEPHYSIWDQIQTKSLVLMTPYMKARYAEGYAIAKCPLVVAVVVNETFLEDDSRNYLHKQQFDIKDTTAFFTTFEKGLNWLKNWGTGA